MPADEVMSPGHLGCAGCGAALAMRLALKALGRETVLVIPTCCSTVIDGPWPYSAAGVPVMHTPSASAAAAATGVRAGLGRRGEHHVTVCAWAGDGTFDIDLQALSSAAERKENIIYVCCDTEVHMNTGVERRFATPTGAWTSTSGAQVTRHPGKDLVGILAAHDVPYVATATIAYPDDLVSKFARARTIGGLRFLHVLAPCPTGWDVPSEQAVHYARLAVASRVFPLLEIDHDRWRLTVDPPPVPVADYVKGQGRFRALFRDEQRIEAMQAEIDRRWRRMQARLEED